MSSPNPKQMGLTMATMLVAGNMIGTGVFLLPANLATVGSISSVGWLIATTGAIALGLVFARITADVRAFARALNSAGITFAHAAASMTNLSAATAADQIIQVLRA